MAIVGRGFATFYPVAHLAWVLGPGLEDFKDDRVAFKALVVSLVVRHSQMARVLQNANNIRVAGVLVHSVEGSMAQGLVLPTYVCLVHSYFDLLHSVFREVWQWNIRTVQKLW